MFVLEKNCGPTHRFKIKGQMTVFCSIFIKNEKWKMQAGLTMINVKKT